MSDYYCLVAGLPDVAFDGSKSNYSIEKFKEDIYPALSADDTRLVNLFFLAWDNENLLKILASGADAELAHIGCYEREQLVELVESVHSGEPRCNEIPEYLYDFLVYYFENEAKENVMWSDLLSAYYYSYAISCPNKFLSEWFTFNLNVNNIFAALLARKYKLNVSECIVGDNEVAESIRTSNARDFGLSGTIDYLDTVIRLIENDRLQEREHLLDELRWNWLEENSAFNYFTVEKLYVFLQKLEIITRWAQLDTETGMQRYNELISGLKGDVDLPDGL